MQLLTNTVGDHALLVREVGEDPFALLTVEGTGSSERLVVVPLDPESVELRVDGDALAVWLSQGSIAPPASNVPGWANAIGFLLLIAVLGFAVIGSLTFFSWLFGALGWI